MISPIFLKRSLISHSIVFLFLFLFIYLFFIFYFLHCSLKNAFLSLLAVLWNSIFSWVYLSLLFCFLLLLFSAILKDSSDDQFAFLFLSYCLERFWPPPPVQCYELLSIVLQACYISGLTPSICSSPPLYNHKRFYIGHT